MLKKHVDANEIVKKKTDHETRNVSARKILYCILFIILCVQITALFKIHSRVGQLTVCDTILLLLINLEESPILGAWFRHKASKLTTPLAHVIACVTVQALSFVTLTHSMEAAFCDDSAAQMTDLFLTITLISLSVKVSAIVYFRIQLISAAQQCILHVVAPSGIVALYTVNKLYSPLENDYLARLDPLLGMLLCLVITAIVLPLFFHHIPSLLCHSPKGIEIEKFKMEVEQNFPNTKCLHVHIYNTYPNDTFDVIMHVAIGIYTQNNNNSNNDDGKENMTTTTDRTLFMDCGKEQIRVTEILNELQNVLCKAGAKNVTIEPHFICTLHGPFGDERFPPTPVGSVAGSPTLWSPCKTALCSEVKGCCAVAAK